MIHLVDTRHLGRPRIIASYLIDLGPDHGLAMVDCGPEVVFESLVDGIQALGRRPEDVKHLLLTHIHFDHAGSAWRWAREFGTTVHVHPRGAAHLLDPAKLVASATRIYGDRMGRLWGSIEAVPAARLKPTEDTAVLDLGGGTRVTALATPGHAPHHLAWHLPDTGTLFAGDVAGVIIGDGREEAGLVPDFEAFVADELRSKGLNEEEIKDYEQADPAFMSVAGLGRYWRKFHPELIELRS